MHVYNKDVNVVVDGDAFDDEDCIYQYHGDHGDDDGDVIVADVDGDV